MARPDTIAVEDSLRPPERTRASSYGGYATLVGISFTPDRFAAAVEYVGISNLVTFLDTALRARDVDVDYLVFDDEGHMFSRPRT